VSNNQARALRRGDPVFLLTVRGFAGESWRLATRPVNVVKADGSVLSFSGGLTVPRFSERIERSGGNPSANAISLEADFGKDLAKLRARGHRLEQATGTLALATIPRGVTGQRVATTHQIWEDTFTIYTSRIVSPVICPPGLPRTLAAFTLQSEVSTDPAAIVDPLARITVDTWPDAPSGALGEVYPVVFGNPGAYTTAAGASATTSGSPGHIIEDSSGSAQKLLLSSGHVSSTTVAVYDSSSNGATVSVINTTDGSGRPVAVVDISGAALTLTDSTFFIGWHASGGGGGLLNPYGTGSLSRAGDVGHYLASLSANGVDRSAWGAAQGALNEFLLAGYWNDPDVSPSEWMRANLSKVAPIEVHGGPAGMRPIFYDPIYPVALAPKLTADPEVVRSSSITQRHGPRDIRNRITVEFAQRFNGGRYRRAITLGPGLSEADEHTTSVCEQSRNDYGIVADETLRADLVYDDTTAENIAAWRLRMSALLREAVSYRLPPHLAGYTTGTLVRLTDSELYLTDAPAVVVEREWTGGGWQITLELINEATIAPYLAAT
jgi:hypothetical protein